MIIAHRNEDIDPVAKARALCEAMPYIRRFRGAVFVVKYGGSFMDDPDVALRKRVAGDIAFLSLIGIHVIVVHGGGKAISRAMDEAGIEVEFRRGLRYTSEGAVKIVDETLNEVVNPEIRKMISDMGGDPACLRGNDVLRCKKLDKNASGEAIDLGFVGEIGGVDTAEIRKALGNGKIPIISPVAVDKDDHPYNTNADLAASQVARALGCRRLVFLCDVPGLMKDPKDPESLISSLRVKEVQPLIDNGIIGSGMLPKIQGATEAIGAGVKRVHFIDGRMPHSLLLEIFTDEGIGTEIISDDEQSSN